MQLNLVHHFNFSGFIINPCSLTYSSWGLYKVTWIIAELSMGWHLIYVTELSQEWLLVAINVTFSVPRVTVNLL